MTPRLCLEHLRPCLEGEVPTALATCDAQGIPNVTYVSPRQLARGSDVFERYVMRPNRALRAMLAEAGVDLMLHDCGELVEPMLVSLASLDPASESLSAAGGSGSR